jgi:hypothetical protein
MNNRKYREEEEKGGMSTIFATGIQKDLWF